MTYLYLIEGVRVSYYDQFKDKEIERRVPRFVVETGPEDWEAENAIRPIVNPTGDMDVEVILDGAKITRLCENTLF